MKAAGILPLLAPAILAMSGDLEKEEGFTQNEVEDWHRQLPHYNVITYHEQSSYNRFEGVLTHHHDSLVLNEGWMGADRFKVYVTAVFKSGTFSRAGDGGYRNWRFAGNWTRQGPESTDVMFHEIHHPGCRVKWEEFCSPEAESHGVKPPYGTDPFTGEPYDPIRDRPQPRAARLLSSTPERSATGDNDGSYLVLCKERNAPSGSDVGSSSGVAYYRDLEPGRNVDQQPDDFVWVARGHPEHWIMNMGGVTFSNGARLHWNVFGGGIDDEVVYNSTVGTAVNDVAETWLYKDAGKELFSTSEHVCYSQYWTY